MTKSKLLASSMLVAASTVMAAGTANAVSLKIGGFGEFWAGYADNDKAAGVNGNFDVKQDAELYFKGEETLDNGLKVGVMFEMEAGNGNDLTGSSLFDESYAYVKASWGQLNIGNNDLATGYVGGVSTVGPVGIIKSDAHDWLPANSELNNTDVDLGMSDAQNITYFTPRVAGFQAIFSFTPDSSDNGATDFDDQETTGLHNALSGAIKYSGKLGGTSLSLGAGYTTLEVTDAVGTAGKADGFNIAGSVGFGAFTLTGAYAKEQITDTDEFWGVSGLYKMNKSSTISIAYSVGTESQNGNSTTIGQDNEDKLITIGYELNMGKGVTFAASAFKTSVSGPALTDANKNDGFGVVSGLSLKF